MTLHKLTAGDGYTYLTRQVAAHDATEQQFGSLGQYYSDKGEAPGIWMGRGLAGVPDFPVGSTVTEAQMLALFGQGRHPNADQIQRAAQLAGMAPEGVDQASRLGKPYLVFEQANEFRRRSAIEFREYNSARGLAAVTPVPAEERARIRTALARTMFVESYDRPPLDARELSGHLARISRQATTAVAGYDLTFSPVKSVSTLWAIAHREIATVIEQAHADAVADTLAWLEDHVAYTRTGHQGVAQVDVRGLIAASFTHRDSRAGDPDLHTHVAISNKVQTLDGRWLALDGRPLHKNVVAASERYNTRLEALLVDRLGVRFADRPGTDTDTGKRPVREIVGVDGPLPRFWSSRRTVIDTRRAVLSAQFQLDHGRPPTMKESVALAQQANLETRQSKHEPRSYAQQRASWRTEALAVLGGDDRLKSYLAGVFRGESPRKAQPATDAWVNETAAMLLSVVASARATWRESHVRAEAERRTRAAGITLPDVDRAVDAIVAAALSPRLSIQLGAQEPVAEPAALRRSDGTSVFTVAGSARYTSSEVLTAERAVLAGARRRDGRVTPASSVDLALLESVANGVELNPGQAQLVHELATSGARVQLALAPAGTGKTTALRALAAAWRAGGGTVVGLAPSAAASAVLREQLGADTDTLAKLVHAVTNGPDVPSWVTSIGPDTLVVVDEAGMASTPDLARMVEFVVDAGGSVRLVGDDRQLAAIGAGGLLRDLAASHGAVSLTQVVRFTDPDTGAPNHAEGAASLALRDGDPAALAYYIDHGRVHVGDLPTVTDGAYTAWAADRAAGRDAIMLAPTRDLVAELNNRARDERLARLPAPAGPEVGLADAGRASAGDAVITRRNERTLPIGATDWVKNGDRWTVTEVHASGALGVVHRRTGRHVTLPADYVREHVTLGYATTVHGAQGVTADSCYAIATGAESRQLLYVALTRGRHANHVFLPVAGDGHPHGLVTRDALLPPTAVDLLSRVLARDDAPTSATSTVQELVDPATQLHDSAGRYRHALTVAAEERLGSAGLAAIDTAADAAVAGLTAQDAYPVLRAHLALCAVAGRDPAQVLREVLAAPRGLDDARDVAAVLDWRIDPTGRHSTGAGPLPWLPTVPEPLSGDLAWGPYLDDRADRVTDLASAVAALARSWTPASAPLWARPLLDRDVALVADLAVWRSAHGIEDADRRPTGPALPAAADARSQRRLDARVAHVLGEPGTVATRWTSLVDPIDPRIAADPYWPVLAERLSTAERAGIDVAALVRTTTSRALPDEQPAAALWWRLTSHLSPAVLAADSASARTLRPGWTSGLSAVVGNVAADRVVTDPQWPALVAAVGRGSDGGWEPAQLLSTAYDLLRAGQPDDDSPLPHELTTALLWRIGLLIEPIPAAGAGTPVPTVLDQPPASHDASGADWMVGLAEPDDTEHAPEPLDNDPGEPAATESVDEVGSSGVARKRLLELNQQAATFFTAAYQGSWAPAYLTDRLGSDLIDDERFTVGYAPTGWTSLTDHLRDLGASDDEIVAAGLGSHASTGHVIDRFRDRIVFAIRDGDEIPGWIGRRNPAHDGEGAKPVPKYLNTAETDLFIKGNELYGLTEGASALADGATPVLVEGPLDTLAVTLAGEGEFVGIAPLGVAFTDAQADRLRPLIGDGRPQVIVATDADPAGQLAADRIFWQLTERGADPRHLAVPNGKDPAELLETAGAAVLRRALADSASLASELIDARIDAYADRLDTVEGQVLATRRATEVIAALPTDSWPRHLTDVVVHTGVAPGIALSEVFDAARGIRVAPGRQGSGDVGSTAGSEQPASSDAGWTAGRGQPAGALTIALEAAQRSAVGVRPPARQGVRQRR
ncbi:MobF family relaxase [Modestobacter muralis]|nr:MobF family relaxase [Modestobacter muralis]